MQKVTAKLPLTLPLLERREELLLPKGTMTLELSDPAERALLNKVMRGHRMFGVVQSYPAINSDIENEELLFNIGCVGKVVSYTEGEETDLVVLKGLCRFDVEDLIEKESYNLIKVSYKKFMQDMRSVDLESTVDRNRLLKALGDYMHQYDVDADWADIINAPSQKIVTALAMNGPFDPIEKQALLETESLTDQCCMITTLMEMATKATHNLH